MTDATPAPPQPLRRDLLKQLALAAALNVLLGLVVSHGYVAVVPAGTTALGWTAVWIAWISTLASFALLALLLFSMPMLLLPRRWMFALLIVCGFGFLQIVLYGDALAFGLFRQHFNQMVWVALTTPGAGDSVPLGSSTIVSIILVVGGILFAEAALAWLALHRRATRFTGRWWLIGLLVGTSTIILTDKVMYACADLAGRTEITRIERYFPLYQRVTVRRLAMRRGWTKPDDDGVVVRSGSSGLLYPRVAVPLPSNPNRLNVVVLAIEGCRFDMLDPAVMPRLHAFAQTHTWGRNHFSGGNSSRFGISSLLYGLHPTYFQQLVSERQGPFLIHALKQLGYDIIMQSCADLRFIEFHKTALVEVPGSLIDTWPDSLPRVERDRAMTDNLVRHIGAAGDQPYFIFGFYDASHASYIYPPEHNLFTPVIQEHKVNFLRIPGNSTVENLRPLFNRYRNSLHYIDEQVGRIIDELERNGQLDRTLLFITGDHGEEFGELGCWGHNGTFSRYQVQTAFVANIPGLPPGPIDRITNHIDVVPTILKAIGISAPPSDYSNGLPLDQPSTRDYVVSVSWDSLALIDAESIMVRGFGSRPLANDFLGVDYRPYAGNPEVLNARKPRLLQLVREMQAFSR